MEREILDTRPPPANAPANCRYTSLIATGDSVTSAHYQERSGVPGPNKCPGTSKNGNDDRFSYAYRAFNGVARFKGGDYYNFARTGFSTREMLGPAPTRGLLDPATKDACGNAWGDTIRHPDNRGQSPLSLVLRAIGYENSKGNDAVWVSTGGVNAPNTNWTAMLEAYLKCHFLRLMYTGFPGQIMEIDGAELETPYNSLNAAAQARDEARELNLIVRGGSCQMTQYVLGRPVADTGRIVVPAFDIGPFRANAGPGPGPDIASDIAAMVQAGLLAGAQQVIWVAYYDMSYATIHPQTFLRAYNFPEAWIPPARPLAFFEIRGAQAKVREHLDNLQSWICAGVRLGKVNADAMRTAQQLPKPGSAECMGWRDAGFAAARDIQNTAVGGSPHPSEAGHNKLYANLRNKL